MMAPPVLSVLLPMHNAAAYVGEAVDSVLAQTFGDFEMLVIDDGSTDASREIVAARRDPRIRLLGHRPNRGIVDTLNRGLAEARGHYIVRMDADDLCHPERFDIQRRHLDEHPDVAVCGSTFEPIGEAARSCWVSEYNHDAIATALLFGNPICHPTVMMRKSVLDTHGLRYPSGYPHGEDYALWVALARVARLENLPVPLLRYRVHAGQISRTKSDEQARTMQEIAAGQLRRLGVEPTSRDHLVHNLFGGSFNPLPNYRGLMGRWMRRLVEANARRRVYPADELERQLGTRLAAAVERQRAGLEAMTGWRRAHWRFIAARSFCFPPAAPDSA